MVLDTDHPPLNKRRSDIRNGFREISPEMRQCVEEALKGVEDIKDKRLIPQQISPKPKGRGR